MFIYILNLVLLIIGALFNFIIGKGDSRFLKIYYFIVMLFTIVIVGSRDMIGGYDIYNYVALFDYSHSYQNDIWGAIEAFSANYEPLYVLYNVLLSFFTDNKYVFIFVTAVITYFLISKSIKKSDLFLVVFFLVFIKFFIISFVYLRQMMAIGILWYGLRYLIKGERIKYSFFILIASLFHLTSVVAILIIPLYNFTFKRRTVLIFLLCSLFMGVIKTSVFLKSYFGTVLGNEKLTAYSDIVGESFNIPYFLEIILMSFLLIVSLEKLYKMEGMRLYVNLFILYLAITSFSINDSALIRLQWFFYIGYAFIVPEILYLYSIKKSRVFLFLLFLPYFSYVYIRNVTLRDEGNFIPYKAFFMDTKRVDKFGN